MYILVINSGSSSLKFQLLNMDNESVIAKGNCERIGQDGTFKYWSEKSGEFKIDFEMKTHTDACKKVLYEITESPNAVIKRIKDIAAIGHRIVHGGEYFSKACLVEGDVIEKIEACNLLAPLHAYPNAAGIRACKELVPEMPQVVVFDTAFHQTMPDYAYMYGLPMEYYEKYKIRRYGFHGTSHKYVSQKAAEFLGRDLKSLRLVTMHLGNGSSLCAIKGGVCIDTSMGLTPLEGPMMGTRCGNIDPAAVAVLVEKEHLSGPEINEIMNKKSGMLAISGFSGDFRDIGNARKEGNQRAILALNMFTYQVKKILAGYIAALGGVDAIVFTAGVGENRIEVRELVTSGLDYLGIKINKEKNEASNGADTADISSDDAAVKTLIISTNEELMIARETMKIVFNK